MVGRSMLTAKLFQLSICLKILMTVYWRKIKKEWLDGEDGIDSRDNTNENGDKLYFGFRKQNGFRSVFLDPNLLGVGGISMLLTDLL